MSKIKNGGLDQYGTKPFEQQQFGTAGVEWVRLLTLFRKANASGTVNSVNRVSVALRHNNEFDKILMRR